MIDNILLDMDGVIVDLHGYYRRYFKVEPKSLSDHEFWKKIADYELAGGEFFYDLPMMPNAHLLYEYCHRLAPVRICTSGGLKSYKKNGEQKKRWMTEHFNHDLSKMIVVEKSAKKAEYATPTTLLIDDYFGSVKPFLDAGGQTILHCSIKDTLNQLDILFHKEPNSWYNYFNSKIPEIV